jgi:hypothetical protein
MAYQSVLICLKLLAVVALGAYLFRAEMRVRFLGRQKRRMQLAGRLPMALEDAYRA